MKKNLIDWYLDIPIRHRRFALPILVAIFWLLLYAAVRVVNFLGKVNPYLGVIFLFLILFFAVFLAIVISLFFYEYIIGIGNKIKNKVVGVGFALAVLLWVFFPIILLKIF